MGLTAKQIKRIARVTKPTERREATRDNEVFEKLDVLKGSIGTDELLDEVFISMSTEEAHATLDFIGQVYEMVLEDLEAYERESLW